MRNDIEVGRPRTSGLVEVLDRVLDKGLFIGGDVKISLAEVELLTIRIRLIVCSLDKARDIGLDWWTYDRHLAPGKVAAADREALEARLLAIEELLATMPKGGNGAAKAAKATRSVKTVVKTTTVNKAEGRPRAPGGPSRTARPSSTRRS
jgi:Gas vesicle protein